MAQRRLKQNFNEVQAILDAVGQKVDKIEGKGLSANDYTDEDKDKLASVEEDAQENVIEVIESDGVELPIENKTVRIPAHKQSDWSQNDSSGKDYIKNRTHWEENGVVHKLHPKFLDMDASPTSGSTKPVISGGVKEALDGKQDVISDLADIRQGAGFGESAYQKPSAGIPASDLAAGVIPDVSGFITRTVNDLANYYLKSETYTKEEVAALIGAIRQFHYEVYAALPATGEGNVLYLIGPTGSGSDKYEEYVYANNGWVKIGDTSIDLSGYVTIEALNQALSGYVTSAALATALTGKVGSETIHNIVELTQAEYDALQTKRGDTMYITTDTTKVYIGGRIIEGTDGKSAYQSWLDQGNTGSEADFLASLKGATGPQGQQGIQGIQGPQGNTGSSVDYPYELVNNLTTDDATKGLSAAMGVVLEQRSSRILPYEGKVQLINILRHAVYDTSGMDSYLDELENILINDPAISLTAVYTPTTEVFVGDSLDVLRPDLVVTITLASGATENVLHYQLSGSLSAATNIITVSFAGLSTTFTAVAVAPVVVDATKFKIFTYPNATGGAYQGIPYISSNAQRYCYPYFDILLTPGKYRFKMQHEGLTSGQYYRFAVTYFDETFRVAGVEGQTTNMSSHYKDYGWMAPVFEGTEATLDIDISDYLTGVGVRLNVSVLNSGGTAINTPTTFKITSCVITPIA